MNLCMAGACGRMGRRILEMASAAPDVTIAGAFDLPALQGGELTVGSECGVPRQVPITDLDTALAGANVVIDFTAPEACVANAEAAAARGVAVVVGTTGLNAGQVDRLRRCAEQVPVVYAPNMSVGVNLLFKLTREVAGILGLDYNCEIIEIHHNQKKDAPSGTAVRLAERAAEGLGLDYDANVVHGREGLVGARPRAEIGMHTMRGGDVVGEHTVVFVGPGERIELTHKAHNRDNFARGSLVAARFALKSRPGLYDMQDVLGLA